MIASGFAVGLAVAMSLYFIHGVPAYARCTQQDIQTGNCKYPGSDNPALTPEMFKECKDLGIMPEKCSEIEILKHRCLGMYCGANAAKQPVLDPVVAEILAGSGMAFAASIIGIRKLRGVKRMPA